MFRDLTITNFQRNYWIGYKRIFIKLKKYQYKRYFIELTNSLTFMWIKCKHYLKRDWFKYEIIWSSINDVRIWIIRIYWL